MRVGISLGDSVAGLYAALGVVAALWRRDRRATGGPGTEIDVALTESILSLMEGALPEYGALGAVRQPTGSANSTAAPTNTYRSRDGQWVLVAANSDPLFRRLARVMEQPAIADDPKFSDNRQRLQNAVELDARIGAWAARIDAQELGSMLDDAGIPNTRVFTIADIAGDPQYRARGMVRSVDDPLQGPMLHPGTVPRIDGLDAPPRSTGPAVGADNEPVLSELLGFDPARIEALRKAGVI